MDFTRCSVVRIEHAEIYRTQTEAPSEPGWYYAAYVQRDPVSGGIVHRGDIKPCKVSWVRKMDTVELVVTSSQGPYVPIGSYLWFGAVPVCVEG